jgi:hypothetical protein
MGGLSDAGLEPASDLPFSRDVGAKDGEHSAKAEPLADRANSVAANITVTHPRVVTGQGADFG